MEKQDLQNLLSFAHRGWSVLVANLAQDGNSDEVQKVTSVFNHLKTVVNEELNSLKDEVEEDNS